MDDLKPPKLDDYPKVHSTSQHLPLISLAPLMRSKKSFLQELRALFGAREDNEILKFQREELGDDIVDMMKDQET